MAWCLRWRLNLWCLPGLVVLFYYNVFGLFVYCVCFGGLDVVGWLCGIAGLVCRRICVGGLGCCAFWLFVLIRFAVVFLLVG